MSTRSQQLGRPARKSTGSRAAASTAARSVSPWTSQMYIFYGALAFIGLVVFIIGTAMVGDETLYDDQVTGMNLAILGVVVANAAGVCLLLAGRRTVTARRVAVLGAVPKVIAAEAEITPFANSDVLVGGEGLTHFHRADCTMAVARDWPALDRAEHERAGRTACGVCRP